MTLRKELMKLVNRETKLVFAIIKHKSKILELEHELNAVKQEIYELPNKHIHKQ